MEYFLFLDDIREPKDVSNYIFPTGLRVLYRTNKWVVVRSYDEFIKHISDHGLPECVSFDHDLSDEHYRPSMFNPDGHYSNYYHDGTFREKTGYHAAEWMINYIKVNKLTMPQVICHSMNPIGKKNIMNLVNDFHHDTKAD